MVPWTTQFRSKALSCLCPIHGDEDKARVTQLAQNWSAILSSMVLCYFATFTLQPSDLASLVNKATGWDLTSEDLSVIGDRIQMASRATPAWWNWGWAMLLRTCIHDYQLAALWGPQQAIWGSEG